jgi:hypothetical protein
MEVLYGVLVLILVSLVLYLVDKPQWTRWRNDHVARLLSDFEAEGRTVHFDPVEATYYGSSPERRTSPTRGWLCLVDRQLLATGHYAARWDVCIPFETIHWVGSVIIHFHDGHGPDGFLPFLLSWLLGGKRALIVGCLSPDGWKVHAWTSPKQKELGTMLAELCGLRWYELGKGLSDFDPITIVREYELRH